MKTGTSTSKRAGERGGSKLKLIFALLIFGCIIFTAVKIVPPYFANYQFQDAIQTESKFALTGYPKRSQDDIQDEVFKKAQELEIPITRDQIRVEMTNTQVNISLDYAVPIDLRVYQLVLQFHPHADNRSI